MRIRLKVILFSLLFALASGAVMGWCFINIRREEAAFVHSRRAMKTFAAVTDIEYFLVRQVRLLESFVLLGDESERLQLVQASLQTRQRLEEWEGAVTKGEALGEDLPAVHSVFDAIAVPANKIRSLLAGGKRSQAMALVEKEFSPNSRRALIKFDGVKRRVQEVKNQSEIGVVQELQHSHLGLMAGLGLVVVFGLAFLSALYLAVINPIQKMRTWADRVARGEKGLAMAAFSGENELTELAQSIGEMAIQLTRPKAYPSAIPEQKDLPMPSRAPTPPAPARPSLAPAAPVVAPAPVSSPPPSSSAPASPEPPPPAPPVSDNFENAVNEFRDILTQMGKKTPDKNRR